MIDSHCYYERVDDREYAQDRERQEYEEETFTRVQKKVAHRCRMPLLDLGSVPSFLVIASMFLINCYRRQSESGIKAMSSQTSTFLVCNATNSPFLFVLRTLC